MFLYVLLIIVALYLPVSAFFYFDSISDNKIENGIKKIKEAEDNIPTKNNKMGIIQFIVKNFFCYRYLNWSWLLILILVLMDAFSNQYVNLLFIFLLIIEPCSKLYLCLKRYRRYISQTVTVDEAMNSIDVMENGKITTINTSSVSYAEDLGNILRIKTEKDGTFYFDY